MYLNQLSVTVWPASMVLWCWGGHNGSGEKLFQPKLQTVFAVLFSDEAFDLLYPPEPHLPPPPAEHKGNSHPNTPPLLPHLHLSGSFPFSPRKTLLWHHLSIFVSLLPLSFTCDFHKLSKAWPSIPLF